MPWQQCSGAILGVRECRCSSSRTFYSGRPGHPAASVVDRFDVLWPGTPETPGVDEVLAEAAAACTAQASWLQGRDGYVIDEGGRFRRKL